MTLNVLKPILWSDFEFIWSHSESFEVIRSHSKSFEVVRIRSKSYEVISTSYDFQHYTSVDGSPLPRCNSESYYSSSSSSRTKCSADMVVNPFNQFTITKNVDFRKASEYHEAVQIKPQYISLKLRISKFLISFSIAWSRWPTNPLFRWGSRSGFLLWTSPGLSGGFVLLDGFI